MFPWSKKKTKENEEFEKHYNVLDNALDREFKDVYATINMLNRLSLLGKLAETQIEMDRANKLSRRVKTKLKYQGFLK